MEIEEKSQLYLEFLKALDFHLVEYVAQYLLVGCFWFLFCYFC